MFLMCRGVIAVALTCGLLSGSALADPGVKAKTPGDHGAARGLMILAERLEALAANSKWATAGADALEARDLNLGRVAMAKQILHSLTNLTRTLHESQPFELSHEAQTALRAVSVKLQTVSSAKNFSDPKAFARGLTQVASDIRTRFTEASSGTMLKLKVSGAARDHHDKALEATAGLFDAALANAGARNTIGAKPAAEMAVMATTGGISLPSSPEPSPEHFWRGANEMVIDMATLGQESARRARDVSTSKKLSERYVERLNRTWRIATIEQRPVLEGVSKDAQSTSAMLGLHNDGEVILPLEKLRILNPSIRCEYLVTKKNIEELKPKAPKDEDEIPVEIDDGSSPMSDGVIIMGD